MKILYGVQGTGNGHLTRSRVMAEHLQQSDLDVTYLISGRDKQDLFAMEPFGDFEHRPGLTFVTNNGKIQKRQTLKKNKIKQFFNDVKALDLTGYDLVISDFEPVSAWAAKQQGVDSIGIGHQYAFSHDIPKEGGTWLTNTLIHKFAPVRFPIGLHWHHFDSPILPPIVDIQLNSSDIVKNKVLVYLPFEAQSEVINLLSKFKKFDFYIYSADLENKDNGNIHTRSPCLKGFKQNLMQSKKVICGAGFELVSECIHIGIDVLVKPLAGQMEQISNAKALQALGLGKVMNNLDSKICENFLTSDIKLHQANYPDVAEQLVCWLKQGRWHEQQELADLLWKR